MKRGALCALSLLWMGCGGAGDGSDAEAWPFASLAAGAERAQVGPNLQLDALRFDGASLARGPFRLDRDYRLEYLPLVGACPGGGCRIRLERVDGRGEATLLVETPARVVGEVGRTPPAQVALFANPVQVELPAQPGRVTLRWSLEGGGAAPALARLALRPADAARPPSILLVCSDTHRADFATGESGREWMPELARFADGAVVYRRAYSPASWTLPAIASLLTGLRPRDHATGKRTAFGPLDELDASATPPGQFTVPWTETGVYRRFTTYPQQLTTLGEVLAREGYTTAVVFANPFYQFSGLHRDGHHFSIVAPSDGAQLNQAVSFLLERLPKERPLFLLVHYMDVHEYKERWFEPAHPGADPYRAGRDAILPAYRRAVQETDRHLGALLAKWDAEVGAERSLTVFFSDHGEHLFDPGHVPVEQIPQGLPRHERVTLRVLNHGNSMDEVLLRVPLVVRWPAALGVPAGVVDRPVSLIDVFPSVLELLGLEPERALDGRSLRAAAVAVADGPERAFFADFQLFGRELASVRQGRFKLVLEPRGRRRWLFDTRLPLDGRGEAGQRVDDAATQQRLEQVWSEYRDSAEREIPVSDEVVDPAEVLEGLKALGYVQ